jgi:hypothetical protein
MKTIQLLLLSSIFILASHSGFSQVKSEKIKVAGECGMCKKKIESAAKNAGAINAVWNVTTKELSYKYNTKTTQPATIEKAIAAKGYDTPAYKADEEAYNKLDDCCKYERSAQGTEAKSCCDHEKCTDAKCMKDGKCTKDMSCCKDSGCDKMDCCKKA